MSACGMGRLRRVSSGGQLSLAEGSLRRSTSCGAFLSTGAHQTDINKRDLLLGAFSVPVAAGFSRLCVACTQPSTSDPDPTANLGTAQSQPGTTDESVAVLMDVMACMSTLYGHTCQHLREVKAGFRSSDAVPENISRSICNFSGGEGQTMLAQFLAAVDDVCSPYQYKSHMAALPILALQGEIQKQGSVLESCYAKLLTGSNDIEVCQVMVKALRACMAATDELVELIMNA